MAPSNSVQTDGRRKGPARLEEAISNPGAVKINVTGAFIVDDEPRSRSPIEADGVHYENKDIRLPHHTGVVSHVAVDVSWESPFLPPPWKNCAAAPHRDRSYPRNFTGGHHTARTRETEIPELTWILSTRSEVP